MNTKEITYAAIITALSFIATYFLSFPTLVGYIHLGDVILISSALFFSRKVSIISVCIGMALADFTLGYTIYIPITILAKGLTMFLLRSIIKNPFDSYIVIIIVVSIITPLIGVLCYFIFEAFMYSLPTAIITVPLNIVQASLVGGILGSLIFISLKNKVYT